MSFKPLDFVKMYMSINHKLKINQLELLKTP